MSRRLFSWTGGWYASPGPVRGGLLQWCGCAAVLMLTQHILQEAQLRSRRRVDRACDGRGDNDLCIYEQRREEEARTSEGEITVAASRMRNGAAVSGADEPRDEPAWRANTRFSQLTQSSRRLVFIKSTSPCKVLLIIFENVQHVVAEDGKAQQRPRRRPRRLRGVT